MIPGEGLGPTDGRRHTLRYTCELSPLHVDSAIFPKIPSLDPEGEFEMWNSAYERSEDKSGHLATWIKHIIMQLPKGIDLARDVDDEGFTMDQVKPCMFTDWVRFEDKSNVFARFAQARTAMHDSLPMSKMDGGALRSPVMGGVVLECTSDIQSLDPRNAVSTLIYEFNREPNANYPHLKPKDGRIFDMTRYRTEPYTVGPLFLGHPNEITNPVQLATARSIAREVLDRTLKSHLSRR